VVSTKMAVFFYPQANDIDVAHSLVPGSVPVQHQTVRMLVASGIIIGKFL
jgi:hypothetical protein